MYAGRWCLPEAGTHVVLRRAEIIEVFRDAQVVLATEDKYAYIEGSHSFETRLDEYITMDLVEPTPYWLHTNTVRCTQHFPCPHSWIMLCSWEPTLQEIKRMQFMEAASVPLCTP